MNTKALFNHNEALIARYGIKEIESFRRSARRYECRISWLNEVACCDSKRYEWAEEEVQRVKESASRNLAKYCRNHRLFLHDLVINRDPRGYALKLEIKSEKLNRTFINKAWRDWGSYYIVAPDLKFM